MLDIYGDLAIRVRSVLYWVLREKLGLDYAFFILRNDLIINLARPDKNFEKEIWEEWWDGSENHRRRQWHVSAYILKKRAVSAKNTWSIFWGENKGRMNGTNCGPSQNQMHMPARVIVSFGDFLSHFTIPLVTFSSVESFLGLCSNRFWGIFSNEWPLFSRNWWKFENLPDNKCYEWENQQKHSSLSEVSTYVKWAWRNFVAQKSSEFEHWARPSLRWNNHSSYLDGLPFVKSLKMSWEPISVLQQKISAPEERLKFK